MTTVLAINSANDMYLDSSSNIAVATGQTAVEQACQTISRVRLTEEVLFVGNGLPFFEAVWIGTPNYDLYLSALTAALAGVDGVDQVVSVVLSVADGILSYTATIETDFGQAIVTGILNG